MLLLFLLSTLILKCATSMDKITADLVTPLRSEGESCGYESCPATKDGMLNVHIVPHTHAELGYTRNFHQHYTGHDAQHSVRNDNMKRILDFVITELWANPARKFALGDMPYFFHWWAKRDGTVRRMVYQLLRQGRLYFVGGGWGMNDEAATSYHAVIDHYTYSLRKLNSTFMECGRPLVAWQADVFGHSREFASLMAQMGFDGLFINPISFDDEIFRMQRQAMEFVWRGSDDLGSQTDIYTHKLFDGYWPPPGFCFSTTCSDALLRSSDSFSNNVQERAREFIASIESRQAPYYNTSHVMVIMGQRFGYYDANMWFANIEKLMDGVNKISHGRQRKMHLMYSSPLCYLRGVHEASPPLETKQDDFFPYSYDKVSYCTGMYTSRPALKLLAREGHLYLQMVKQLQVLAKLWNNDKKLEDFKWIMGVIQDHNIISGALKPRVKSYYVKKITKVIQQSTLILKQAFNKLRKSPSGTIYYRCPFNISSCLGTNGNSSYMVIYNPLAWPVTMPVRLPSWGMPIIVHDSKGEKVKTTVVPIPNAVYNIPLRTSLADHELVFMAKDIPPLGFKSYFVEVLEFVRYKRSIIKKLKKNATKKYLTRQTNPTKTDSQVLLDDMEADYEYFDDNATDVNLDDVTEASTTDAVVTTTDEGDVSGNVIDENVDYLKPDRKVLQPNYTAATLNTPAHVTTEVVLDTTIESFDNESITENDVNTLKTTGYNKDSFRKAYNEQDGVGDILDYSKINMSEPMPSKTPKPEEKEPAKSEVIEEKDYASLSNDLFIENKYIYIGLNEATKKVETIALINGLNTSLDIQFYYYASDDPAKLRQPNPDNKFERSPGAYIFRAMDNEPVAIIDYIHMKVFKHSVVQELQCSYSDYASWIIRLYPDSPVVEVEWMVGSIPVDDGIGKEVFIRYQTDLQNEGVFYTDSNGRQTVKRVKNMRPLYDNVNKDPVAGNIYPVTSKIYLEDVTKNMRFSVFNDRAQGGMSIHEGVIDIFLNRRILTDDSGTNSYLNETTINDKGIYTRGKHYLYLSKADYKPNKIFEKKFAKEIELRPQVLVTKRNPYGAASKRIWETHVNEFSFLKNKLPIGVHLLTIESWNDGTILLRIENYLEKSDTMRSGIKKVFIRDLFTSIRIKRVKETTLGGNIWLNEFSPLLWKKRAKFFKNFNDYYGNLHDSIEFSDDEDPSPHAGKPDLDAGLILRPQQIRTFVCWYDYV